MVRRTCTQGDRSPRGFTLIELLVVLAAIGLLLGIAAPRYFEHVDRAREAALRQNLATLRDAIDKFAADRGRYPESLEELARERYVREVPVDPLTERQDTWTFVAPNDIRKGRVQDVRSGASGKARDGRLYAQW